MSIADQIKEDLTRSLQRAKIEAEKAAAASEVATFAGAQDAFDGALKEEADALRKIKAKKTGVQRKQGESPEVAEARGHEARASAEADAEIERAEVMEGMYPIARQRDQVSEHLRRSKERLSSLMGGGSQSGASA